MGLSSSWNETSRSATQDFQIFYGTRKFITVFTRAQYWSLSWARSIQSTRPHHIFLWSILSNGYNVHHKASIKYGQISFARFKVLTALTMNDTLVWGVIPHIPEHIRSFGGTSCCHLQGILKLEAAHSCEVSLTIYHAIWCHIQEDSNPQSPLGSQVWVQRNIFVKAGGI
jgi:hypothetical protein